jgi:hypothetical protein
MKFGSHRLETPGFVAGDIPIASACRPDRVVSCLADAFPLERSLVECAQDSFAAALPRDLRGGTAVIKIDEDGSINVVRAKLRRKYFALRRSGDSVQLTELLTELGENSGCAPERASRRSTFDLSCAFPLRFANTWSGFSCLQRASAAE